jgi:two-component system, NarL family, nitrate/nitrite response regulator NarL
MPLNLLIVEDHPIVSDGLQGLLEASELAATCHSASTGKMALAKLNGHRIDLIILDINLPDMNGIDLCADIISRYPSMPILALTSYDQLSYIEKMMNNGASGYILKNSDTEEIIEAVKEIMAGNKYLGAGIKEILKGKRTRDNRGPVLTTREKEVLQYVVKGLTNQEIADTLFISLQTAISHRKNILIKMEARNTAELVRLAIEQGYAG